MPCMEGLEHMACASCSITTTNNKGNKGQPCRVPLNMEKLMDQVPFTITEAEGVEYRDIIYGKVF